MRLLIAAGGTGGGVYPALSVAQTLISDWRLAITPNADLHSPILWIGGGGGMEAALVQRAGLPFRAIHGGGVHGVGWRLPRNTVQLVRGLVDALGLVRAYRPNAVLVTGGFITVPVALAAWLRRVPVLVYLPDIEPALAVNVISRVARRIAVTVEQSLAYFRGRAHRVVVTGYPVRPELAALAADPTARETARAHFGLDPNLPALLVSGASTGANRLNRAIAAFAPEFLRESQLVHLCGRADEAWLQDERERLAPDLRGRWRLHAYLHDDMAQAMATCDLAVMRSGASTLGELPATRLPAVLVPGEYEGWDQSPNARYLESEGAAVMLPQARLERGLQSTVMGLLADAPRLQRMRDSLARLARPDAATNLARLVTELAGAREAVPA